MTKTDFAACMAVIAAGCGKNLTEEAMTVYYDLLKDLPLEALQVAAKQALLESLYPVFPTVGLLRKFATAAITKIDRQPLSIEAWEISQKAVRRWGLNRQREALAGMPLLVAKTVSAIGWQALCDATLSDMDTIRAQFVRAYETIVGREQRTALLPQEVQEIINGIGIEAQPPPIDNRSGAPILRLHLRKDKA